MSVAGFADAQGADRPGVGRLLIAECTDPLTAIDIPNLLSQTGDTLEDTPRAGDVIIFRIRKR